MGRPTAVAAAVCVFLSACGPQGLSGTSDVRWEDGDRTPIPKPAVTEEYRNWDFLDHNLFYQVGKVLDLDWTGRRVGGVLGLGQGKQADNLNRLDEVPNSAWFTNRHFLHPMTVEELAAGPSVAQPDTSGPWEVVSGKFHGVSAGFTIRDPQGETFVLKFDTKAWPEMASSAEVISTKILHAAGYNVPENSVVTFFPSRLRLGPKARVRRADGGRRPMVPADLDSVFAKVSVGPDGRLRAMSSAFLKGEPIGPFKFHGRRHDDPNDRVDHEHRRELRGLKVIASWLNDADRRTSNTLDVFIRSGDTGYVRHYLIDMGSTLGSNSRIPHLPRYGVTYLWSPRNILKKVAGLGLVTEDWERPVEIAHPTIGYFSNDHFNPGGWVTAYPNPAFQWCNDRDGYWGAKIVMAFTDAQVAAIVKTGRLTDPDAERVLTDLLIERRDAIGRHWFARVCPLDRFRVTGGRLVFDDLAVDGGLDPPERVQVAVRSGAGWERVTADGVPLPATGQVASFEFERRVDRAKPTRVRVGLRRTEETWQVVRVSR